MDVQQRCLCRRNCTNKAEDFDAFYLRAKNGIPGAVRISIKYGRPVNQDVAQDLKYGTSIAETSEVSQTRNVDNTVLTATDGDQQIPESVTTNNVTYVETDERVIINEVTAESLDGFPDVYLVSVKGENLTKDTSLYIYDSSIEDSVAQSLSLGYLDENDSNIGELVDMVAYNVYPEKPGSSSFGTLEFIPEEGVVCVNTSQTFGAKHPISFVSSYEMKIAMKGVLGVNSYSVFAKDDASSFLHKNSFL